MCRTAEPARFSAEGGQSMPRVRKPATPTEVKVRKPGIALGLVLGGMLGGMLGMMIALVRSWWRNENEATATA